MFFWKSEQVHFILATNGLFRDLGLNWAGEILICLLAAYVACRETKLEGCADSIKTVTHRSNTCYRHGPSISSLTTQLRLHYALNIDSDPFKGFGAAGKSACVATSPSTLRPANAAVMEKCIGCPYCESSFETSLNKARC